MSYVNRGSIKSTEHHTTVIATDGINMCEAGRQTELRDSASTGEEVGIAQRIVLSLARGGSVVES